ncbi:MAG: hypothetical protein A3B44_02365 [Candidatus Levybacteria bacterium RIFCSPLOWO2_01_FULL_38_21]|nr:MAG: hypothetical protein A3B44_02365 [Candidatus Levybacteria bacterium RIFCSPLOWO2_01_FULL_38_21]
MPKTVEAAPRPIVELKDEAIFIGSDGIALTEYGSLIHRLLHHQHFLIQMESKDGTSDVSEERRKELLEERNQMCEQLGFEPMLLGIVSNKFFSIINRRMRCLERKN